MPTQADLTAISDRLRDGYFLKEDMDSLDLSGYVSLDAVRERVRELVLAQTPPPVPTQEVIDQAAALRAQQSQAAAQTEAKQVADRMNLIATIQLKKDEAKQAIQEQNAAQATLERFQAAIKADPNVQKTS
jgi:hypothetical protein